MGDSHVRRIAVHRNLLHEKLNRGEVSVSFLHRGGAELQFILQNMDQARGFDIVIVKASGNDLANGAQPPYYSYYYDSIEAKARELNISQVIITSLWPRHNPSYHAVARQHFKYWSGHYSQHNFITFWSWDRRQSYRTYDGTHLEQRGYEKAVQYLIAPILWAVKWLERRQN